MDLDRGGMATSRHRPSARAGTLDPSPSGAQEGRSRVEKVAIGEAELKRKFVDLVSLGKVEEAWKVVWEEAGRVFTAASKQQRTPREPAGIAPEALHEITKVIQVEVAQAVRNALSTSS